LSDSFKFLEPDSRETDIWKFPSDAHSLTFLKPIPLFPSLDILMVHHAANEIFRHWNLSRWLSTPFLSILDTAQTCEIEPQETVGPILGAIDSHHSKYMRHVWLREISAFNIELPHSTESTASLSERRKFLLDAARAETPRTVRLSLLNDPQSFLEVFKFELANRSGTEPDTLNLELHFGPPEEDDFAVEGLYILNGRIDHGVLCPPDGKGNPFSALQNVRMRFVKFHAQNSKSYLCPIFKRPQINETVQNLANNFVADVALETKKGDRFWLLNSTAIYITIPDEFK
jgi:hypothetical protein